MKRSNFLFIILLFCFSCTEEKLLVTSLLENEPHEEILERKLASSDGSKICMKDTFSVDTLKAEILELERPYLQAEKIEGEWRNFQLSELKVPEANFLKTFGDEIGNVADPESMYLDGCKDLVCIFNRIYGRDDELPGLVHYLWYLKFGHMLSLDNHVPKQKSEKSGVYNGKDFPMESYLFSHNELYGFWRLTHMLKAPHEGIPHLRQIQRVPRGEKFEESDYRIACGLSSGAGWIKLTDKCLELDGFYEQVVHEMNHHIDYDEGRRLYQASHRSQQKDYLKLSGFSIFEFKDENGNLFRSWKRKKLPLISEYAGFSPQENFAEVLSWFRIDGDFALKKMSPEQYGFVSKNYYGKQEFRKESIIKKWVGNLSTDINHLAARISLECEGSRICFESRFSEVESGLRSKIKLTEPEGCSILEDQIILKKWKTDLRKEWNDLSTSKGLSKAELKPVIAAKSFVSCFGEQEDCYQNEILNNFSDEAKAQVYLGIYPWNVIQGRVMKEYKTLLSKKQNEIRVKATNLWKSCGSYVDDQESPSGEAFGLGEGYLVSSIYNCLNSELPKVRDEFLKIISAKNEKEALILSSLISLEFVKILKEIYVQEKKKESLRANNCLPANLRYHLKKDFPASRACSLPKTRS